ncbi:hypothetical protein [Caenimonas soli]|uniref:hypothetical protein n=1 Tax=Caenimonas soli TaxID=2735555 RepID=UPI0015518095|nr:hypothetical protein [Caenimonas soli]NPC57879.1 hypothetical protein [Caenimonas soli]
MKLSTLSLSFALAQLFAVSAFAQQPPTAESYPPGSAAPAVQPKATSVEKAEGKVLRKRAGSDAAKKSMPGEGTPIPEAAARVPKTERQAARSARKAESARANKAGEITSRGEIGLAK